MVVQSTQLQRPRTHDFENIYQLVFACGKIVTPAAGHWRRVPGLSRAIRRFSMGISRDEQWRFTRREWAFQKRWAAGRMKASGRRVANARMKISADVVRSQFLQAANCSVGNFAAPTFMRNFHAQFSCIGTDIPRIALVPFRRNVFDVSAVSQLLERIGRQAARYPPGPHHGAHILPEGAAKALLCLH